MLPDSIFSVFVQSLGTGEVLVSLLGIVAAAAFAGLLATKLGELILPRPKETQVADFLPFERLKEDGTTIECHDGTLLRVFAIKGMDLALVQPEVREAMLEARKSFVDSMGDLNVVARIITIRELVPLGDEVRHENKLLAAISDQWDQNLNRVFRNRHYIILSVKERKNHLRDLNQAAQALTAVLDAYEPTALFETKESDLDIVIDGEDTLPEEG